MRNMKLYDLPIKTFNPDRLMEELSNAKDGDVFILKEENVSENIGDYWPELTIAQVKKVREPRSYESGMVKSTTPPQPGKGEEV